VSTFPLGRERETKSTSRLAAKKVSPGKDTSHRPVNRAGPLLSGKDI
jgi:hypothetical protein